MAIQHIIDKKAKDEFASMTFDQIQIHLDKILVDNLGLKPSDSSDPIMKFWHLILKHKDRLLKERENMN